jgi:hypothetical protein
MNKKDTVIEVEGTRFQLIKKGRAQVRQVKDIGRWLAIHGPVIFDALRSVEGGEEEAGPGAGLGQIGKVVEALSEDSLLDLYQVVLGCEKQFAEEYFDIMVMIDAATLVYKEHPTVARLVDRFFSTKDSDEEQEDNSMTSE